MTASVMAASRSAISKPGALVQIRHLQVRGQRRHERFGQHVLHRLLRLSGVALVKGRDRAVPTAPLAGARAGRQGVDAVYVAGCSADFFVLVIAVRLLKQPTTN